MFSFLSLYILYSSSLRLSTSALISLSFVYALEFHPMILYIVFFIDASIQWRIFSDFRYFQINCFVSFWRHWLPLKLVQLQFESDDVGFGRFLRLHLSWLTSFIDIDSNMVKFLSVLFGVFHVCSQGNFFMREHSRYYDKVV